MFGSEGRLFRSAFRLLNPAVVLPQLDVLTIDHLPGLFLAPSAL
jgi:hypothetical protein